MGEIHDMKVIWPDKVVFFKMPFRPSNKKNKTRKKMAERGSWEQSGKR